MMTSSIKQLALSFSVILLSTTSYSQGVNISYSDGTNLYYDLVDVRKITFDADLMNLLLWDGSTYSWNVSTVGDYQYQESSLNVQEILNNVNTWNVKTFPNPTSTYLNIHFHLPDTDDVSIALFDNKGKLLIEKNLGKKNAGSHHELMDLQDLPQGLYNFKLSGLGIMITKQVIKQ